MSPYVGISGAMERLELFYEKTVDNTDPRNTSPSRGQVHRADDTAAGATYGVGFLAGYRLPLGAGGTYLSPEVDLSLHGGAVSGYIEGAGLSEGRNQLGESWPEDWSFEERRSYGLTVRLGGRNLGAGDGVRAERVRPRGPAPPRRPARSGLRWLLHCHVVRGGRAHAGDGEPRRELHRVDGRRRPRKEAGKHRDSG